MAKITINDFAKKAYKRYIAAGMTPSGACGLMGNQYAESDGFVANRVEYLCLKRLKENGKIYTHETYTDAVNSGVITKVEFLNPLPGKRYGYGISQFTTTERKSGLYSFTIEKGKSIADEDAQLDYVLYEMNTMFPKTFNVLKTATSVKEASDYVLIYYEAPADTGTTVKNVRADYSQQYYDYFVVNKEEGENNMSYDKYINNTETHYISNSGSDENGKYYGGTAGDQTGNEWCLRSWYNRPWNCVLRHSDETVRLKLAELACAAALNDCVGYDQYQRDTYWTQLQKANYDPSKITVKCESDCSAGVIANTKAVGYLLGISALKNISATYTGNMKTGFKAAGFTVLTDSKYLNGTEYLLPGDILLNEKSHTATNITKGSKAVSTSSTTSSSTITTTTNTTSSSVILKLGSTGSAVKTLQTLLNKLGCGLVVDGEFGSKTDAAVRKFQSANDLVVDGEYGPLSKAKLEALCAEKDTQASTSTKAYGTADKADIALAGTYQTTTALNMRYKAAVLTSDNVVCVLPQGAKVQCYKYYTVANGVKWLYVAYGNKVGFVSKEYLKKIN